MDYRKLVIVSEEIRADGDSPASHPISRVAACAIVANPMAGKLGRDLSALIAIGADLGQLLVEKALKQLPGEPQAYGKAALVGVAGELEHGAAVIHPAMGKPIREAMGGGRALIPSNAKIGGPGSVIDIPLGHRHDAWLFDFIDTMSVYLPDGPRPNEIAVILALSDGGRPFPRI